jgi:hypothetical protein
MFPGYCLMVSNKHRSLYGFMYRSFTYYGVEKNCFYVYVLLLIPLLSYFNFVFFFLT